MSRLSFEPELSTGKREAYALEDPNCICKAQVHKNVQSGDRELERESTQSMKSLISWRASNQRWKSAFLPQHFALASFTLYTDEPCLSDYLQPSSPFSHVRGCPTRLQRVWQMSWKHSHVTSDSSLLRALSPLKWISRNYSLHKNYCFLNKA